MFETKAKKIKLFEKYRPIKFDDVLGQSKAVKQVGDGTKIIWYRNGQNWQNPQNIGNARQLKQNV